VKVSDNLKLDYEQTCPQIRAFTDIRFKLLAFVPTLTGIAVALLGNVPKQGTVLAVGLLGLFVTLGLAFYEMRNTVLYNAALDRAKLLELCLGMLQVTPDKERGGLFIERPPPPIWCKFKRFAVRHNQALAFVYGAALGGWAYIVLNSLLTLLSEPLLTLLSKQWWSVVDAVTSLASVLLAVIVALIFAKEWRRLLESTSKLDVTESLQYVILPDGQKYEDWIESKGWEENKKSDGST